jgi:hypothetical protein
MILHKIKFRNNLHGFGLNFLNMANSAVGEPVTVKWLHNGLLRRFCLADEKWTYECLIQTIGKIEPGFDQLLCYRGKFLLHYYA